MDTPTPTTEPAELPPMTLVQRLCAIKAEIGALGKTERMNQDGGYNFRGIDSILDAAHDALCTHQVLIWPVCTDCQYDARAKKGGGSSMTVAHLEVTWGVAGPDGEALIPAPITRGEAFDSSDKATNKAHTAAYKVLLSELFAIPYSEHDPDTERPELAEQRTASDPWPEELRTEAAGLWDNLPAEYASKVLARLRERASYPRLESPLDLQASWAPIVRDMLRAAHKAADEAASAPTPTEGPEGQQGAPGAEPRATATPPEAPPEAEPDPEAASAYAEDVERARLVAAIQVADPDPLPRDALMQYTTDQLRDYLTSILPPDAHPQPAEPEAEPAAEPPGGMTAEERAEALAALPDMKGRGLANLAGRLGLKTTGTVSDLRDRCGDALAGQ